MLLNYLPNVVTTTDAGAGVGYTGMRVRGVGAQVQMSLLMVSLIMMQNQWVRFGLIYQILLLL